MHNVVTAGIWLRVQRSGVHPQMSHAFEGRQNGAYANTFYSLTMRTDLDTVGSESFSFGILVEQGLLFLSYRNV